MSTVWQNTAGACSKSFPAAGLSLMGLLPPARPSALPASLPCAELFLAGGERLRQMSPCDGCRSLPCVERRLVAPFRAPQTHIGVCKSGRVCIAKKLAPTVTRPRMQRKRRPRFLPALSLCLPAKTCRCKSGQAPGCISRIFFSPTICIVCRSTYYYYDYYCRTIISPFFATVKNVRFG